MDTSFEIVLQKSGRTLQVPPDKSILDVLLDAVLNDDEQESNAVIMVCCSRSETPTLVLDF